MANILVTGASKGIGKDIATLLCKTDNNIFVTSRSEISDELKFCDKIQCDLTIDEDLNLLKEFIKEKNIDILINNAGEYIYKNTDEMTQLEISKMIKTNLEAPIFLAKCAIPYMKEHHWGRIINIGSISGVMGEAYASVYSATKAGLIGFGKALALELAEYNITVNTINPGWVETDLGLKSIEASEFTLEETLQTIPQKRFVKPSEIEKTIEFLTSEDARTITGQSINICAGLSVGI